ncbi:hypothetical protein [Rhizobium leguminosarum]|uniref:hypothetical protein n=1 Tax=Rhizobium leguminosarum TaxID=384 RepID=UPI003F9BE2A0
MKKSATVMTVAMILLPTIVGCVGASTVQMAEVKYINRKTTGIRTLQDNVDLAGELANQYINLSDEASGAQDIAALGIIGAAGAAAGGLLYDANLNLIKGAGLAAGTMTATSSYFKPGETSTALLDAAEQMICIRKAGEPFLERYAGSAEAGEILAGGILTARLNLRKRLNRTMPDYRSLVESLGRSYAARSQSDAEQLRNGPSIEELRTSVATCLLPRG